MLMVQSGSAVVRVELSRWIEQTRALLTTCELVVSTFGTKKECQSWRRSIVAATEHLDSCSKFVKTKSVKRNGLYSIKSSPEFVCSLFVARLVSPLLEIVCGPMPPFIVSIRRRGLSVG